MELVIICPSPSGFLFFAFLGPCNWSGTEQGLHKCFLNERTRTCSGLSGRVKLSVELDPFIFYSILLRLLFIPDPFYFLIPLWKLLQLAKSPDLNFHSWLKRSIINCWRWMIGIWGFIILLYNKTFLKHYYTCHNISRNQRKRKKFHPDSWYSPNQFFFPAAFQFLPRCIHNFVWL